MTLGKLIILAYYVWGFQPSYMYLNSVSECQVYKTQMETFPGGRFNGNVLSATFQCVEEVVPLTTLVP